MQHKERVRAVLAGEPVDRLPVSVWGHDFLREGSAADLANQTVERHRQYDYDFVKINPRWTLFAEPWGIAAAGHYLVDNFLYLDFQQC